VTLLYVLRHPETTWNVEKRYQGRLESPLSDEGRLQAKGTAHAVRETELDVVYSSPLGRARYLAEQIGKVCAVPVVIDQRLTEMGQCPWEGLYLAEIQQRFPELYERWYSHPESVTFPMGENLASIKERVFSAFEEICARYSGGIAVVTHSVVIQTVVATVLGLDLARIHRVRIDNASITSLAVTGSNFSLLALNSRTPYIPPARASHSGDWAMERRAS